jgi:ATP-binding cassette, subfamily G (WHITE), member 2, SNQ2
MADYSSSRSSPIDSPLQKYEEIHSGHVDVQRAEAEFQELDAELKKTFSHRSQSLKHQSSRTQNDPEKGSTVDEEPFDLEGTLRGDRADAEASGLKFKQIGVLWKNLTVQGVGGSVKIYVKTFPDAFTSFFDIWSPLKRLFSRGKGANQINILSSFRGLVKPGEMCLILGRPGGGCTTFLKVISNQRFGYTNISGEVLYGPFNHSEFSKRYRGEAVYNAEDESNSMLPTLTVGQTLAFALDTKVPGNRPGGLSRKEFKKKVIALLLRMFNIRVSHLFADVRLRRHCFVSGISADNHAAYRKHIHWRTIRPWNIRWREKAGLHCRDDGNERLHLRLG